MAKHNMDGAQTSEERLAQVTAERDVLRELADRRGRLIDGTMTVNDAMQAYARTLINAPPHGDNCMERGGTIRGRQFLLSIQWFDGKTPLTLLMEMTAERDAAVAARDALAGAAAAVRDARAAASAAGARYSAAWDAVVAMPPTALQSEGIAAALRVSYEAQETLDTALTTLLRGAPGGYVAARVVRECLTAVDERLAADRAIERAEANALFGESIDDAADDALLERQAAAHDAKRAARTALDAALAAATTTPKESL